MLSWISYNLLQSSRYYYFDFILSSLIGWLAHTHPQYEAAEGITNKKHLFKDFVVGCFFTILANRVFHFTNKSKIQLINKENTNGLKSIQASIHFQRSTNQYKRLSLLTPKINWTTRIGQFLPGPTNHSRFVGVFFSLFFNVVLRNGHYFRV